MAQCHLFFWGPAQQRLQLKLRNTNFEFSAIAKKVVIRQLLTAAVNKCSGDHIPGIPFGNSGGVATSMQLFVSLFNSGEHIRILRALFQFTSYKYYVFG